MKRNGKSVAPGEETCKITSQSNGRITRFSGTVPSGYTQQYALIITFCAAVKIDRR